MTKLRLTRGLKIIKLKTKDNSMIMRPHIERTILTTRKIAYILLGVPAQALEKTL